MVTHEPRVQARVEGGTVVATVSPNGAAITTVNRNPEREEMRAMTGRENTPYLEAAVVLSAPPSSLPQGQPLSCMAEPERESSGAEQERERFEAGLGVQPPCSAAVCVAGAASVGTAAVRKGFWSPGVVLRLSGPPPELLATSAVAGKLPIRILFEVSAFLVFEVVLMLHGFYS
ncbi:uncharacterized protein LOC127748366 [Arachis duranensis]|uniref:Uncharacterized protein LOC127748366 n=1 Tax=Arachis duranensis TaxID=130453 RepID=A0A9C6WWI3_ARADU|nr:uncharacterized protein LOC127748366 [Arachis duranensis]XP_052118668.1 uncharacterized protein LOC127748366 [Arachis duranensis]